MQLDAEEVAANIWRVPFADRCAILSMSIVGESEQRTLKACEGMLGMLMHLARYLPMERRIELSNVLRDVADECEVRLPARVVSDS